MLPFKFEERMKSLLGSDYENFKASLAEPPVKAVRVNSTKISVENYLKINVLPLSKIDYTSDCFILGESEGIGNTPEHHSGMIYVQDPGAMATVNALDVKPGWWVLDACSAPGGKASQLSSLIGEEGFILANEYVPKRAKIIVGNFERLGIKNALVTSLDTAEFKNMFSATFDLVLCDAPCSGEGMFRKYDAPAEEWSEENVSLCAKRQKEIINNCAPLVKPGGYLLYSTCTYSPEENEEVVISFLDAHPDFYLVPAKDELTIKTEPGIISLSKKYDLSLTRRFYPHKSRGEGQYIALLKKRENSVVSTTILYKSKPMVPLKEEVMAVESFFSANMQRRPIGRLVRQGEGVAIIPHPCPIPNGSVFMPGVMVGEVRKGILFPHHQFFSAYGSLMLRQENLRSGDPRLQRYLRGEEIEGIDVKSGGYTAVMYEGVALGGGKASGGVIKNHYPKGLRINK